MIRCIGVTLKSILFMAICMSASLTYASESHRVTFFNPHSADDAFWQPVTKFMQAAAKDLNIELSVLVANHDREKMIAQVRTVVSGQDKPDVIVFKNFKSNGAEILELAEQYGVHAFIFNAGLIGENATKYPTPRAPLKHWIGQMLPGDAGAGEVLAEFLINEGLATNEPVNIIGLTGNLADSPAIARNAGLKKALVLHELQMEQLIPANWTTEQAFQATKGLLKRYPATNIIWCANDSMALGAHEASVKAGRVPGKDIFIGGIDWQPNALELIQRGGIAGSVGGHFMEGGWAMVLIYDYLNGNDFKDTIGVDIHSEMSLLTPLNIEKYITQFTDDNWDRIDFKRFSIESNPAGYDFSLNAALKQL